MYSRLVLAVGLLKLYCLTPRKLNKNCSTLKMGLVFPCVLLSSLSSLIWIVHLAALAVTLSFTNLVIKPLIQNKNRNVFDMVWESQCK